MIDLNRDNKDKFASMLFNLYKATAPRYESGEDLSIKNAQLKERIDAGLEGLLVMKELDEQTFYAVAAGVLHATKELFSDSYQRHFLETFAVQYAEKAGIKLPEASAQEMLHDPNSFLESIRSMFGTHHVEQDPRISLLREAIDGVVRLYESSLQDAHRKNIGYTETH